MGGLQPNSFLGDERAVLATYIISERLIVAAFR